MQPSNANITHIKGGGGVGGLWSIFKINNLGWTLTPLREINNLFQELFYLYKHDCDKTWQFQWAGLK